MDINVKYRARRPAPPEGAVPIAVWRATTNHLKKECSAINAKKPLETRMGKGKGNTEGWVAKVKPGRVLFEASGCSESVAKEAMALAAAKLSVRCKFLSRES